MQTIQRFLEPSRDDLYIRYAAMHIVALPITVSAAWRATNTYNSLENPHSFHMFNLIHIQSDFVTGRENHISIIVMQQENFHNNVSMSHCIDNIINV